MSSVECLREFVNQRLSAAAEEIFGVFKRAIVEYQEEIERQRGLLDVIWKPDVRLHRIELPQSRVCKQEEVLSDQQLCLQERNPSVDQEDPDPPQIKEEQEELCSSQEGEQLEPKQEADTFTLTPTCEETHHSDGQLLDWSSHQTPSVLQNTCRGYISVKRAAVVEPNNDHQRVKLSLTSNKESAPSGQKPFVCKKCGKYLQHKKSLLAHIRKFHSVDQPYVCNTCGKRFIHESAFQVHKGVHSDKKPFSCKICGKVFKFNSCLRIHMQIHTGEKPHSCIACGKTFTQKSHLKYHFRLHTGEKPHSCITCGKTFTTKSHLNYHIRSHTGEKPYSCITCGKAFPSTSQLKSHTIVHTGEKPFSCKICESGFRSSFSLKLHMRRRHKHHATLVRTCSEQLVS